MSYKITPFLYKNYRGEYSLREVEVQYAYIGSTEYHLEEQILIRAWDSEKNAERDFALKDCCFLTNLPVTDRMIGAAQAELYSWTDEGPTDTQVKAAIEAALKELFIKR